MNWTDLQQVLLWLTGVGSPAVIMYLLSYLAENWNQWSLLPHWVKFYLPMILSIGLTIGASQLLSFPDIIASIQPWFQMIVTAILAYLASQNAYMKTKATKYGARFAQPKAVITKKK